MVVGSHASLLGLQFLPGLDLSGIGKHGVYLFFVISAFLLTLQWLQRPIGGAGAGFLGAYLLRRAARIFPLYLVVLIAGYALPPAGKGLPADGQALLMHLLMLQGDFIYWSIPVEFKYYLLIPLVAGLIRCRLAPTLKTSMMIVALVLVIWMFPPALSPANSIDLVHYLPIFMAGSVAAWWWSHACYDFTLSQRVKRLSPWDLLFIFGLVVSTPMMGFLPLIGFQGADALHRSFIAWGVVWSAVLLLLLAGWLPLWRWLFEHKGMRACGQWCFGIYLLHMPALYVARKLPVPEFIKAWVGLGLALLAAAIAYRLIEKPAISWAARCSKRWR
jgi:peptidoglycan/LPS O-acetylase OafA/YrhL